MRREDENFWYENGYCNGFKDGQSHFLRNLESLLQASQAQRPIVIISKPEEKEEDKN